MAQSEMETRIERTVQANAAAAALPGGKLFMQSIWAGIFIALGGALMLIVKSDATISFGRQQVLMGIVFSAGLFMVMCAGSQLFTGDCLMLIGYKAKKFTFKRMVITLGLVLAGNIVGTFAVALILALAGFGGMNAGAVGKAATSLAHSKMELPIFQAFLRAILCNIAVCVAVWMANGSKTVVDKLICAMMPLVVFVACGFEHSVANMFFLPFGILCAGGSNIMIADLFLNAGPILLMLFVVIIGNIVGGAFVAISYWFTHVKD